MINGLNINQQQFDLLLDNLNHKMGNLSKDINQIKWGMMGLAILTTVMGVILYGKF